jgi:polyferredoxin
VVDHGRHAGHLLRHALDPLGPRPDLPDQAVLVDLGNRRFFFFMIEIWPHEFYFVAGLLIMAGLGLFLFTSALGRVWCGYTCPQTVWTDLFILVERWVEGDRNARVKLWNAKWDAQGPAAADQVDALAPDRARHRRGLGLLLHRRADAPARSPHLRRPSGRLHDHRDPDRHDLPLRRLRARAGLHLHVPLAAHPGRDDGRGHAHVAYRDWRGEPRGKHRKAEGAEALGDCIDCNACVHVCPMGIDIRDGQQLACITCALCIDACDDVMAKIGKPRGLIDYIALTDETRERAGEPPKIIWSHVFRPRTILYTVLWALVGVGLTVALFLRQDIDITVAPVRNPTFVMLSDGSIRNTYDVRLRNMQLRDATFSLSLTSDAPLRMELEGREDLTVDIPANEHGASAGLRDRRARVGRGRNRPHRLPPLDRGQRNQRPRLEGHGLQWKRGVKPCARLPAGRSSSPSSAPSASS